MAESLRRLVNIASFTILQEKLDRWLDEYHTNTCDQNVGRCCEIVELNARVQAQLFKLLSLCSSEGGLYGGASVLKSRLLPWLGQGLAGTPAVTTETSLSLLADSAAKDRELNQVQDMYERSISQLEDDLRVTREEADVLKDELTETRTELDDTKRQSTSDKMFISSEVDDLRAKLRVAEDEMMSLRNKGGLADTYERQIRRLKDDIAILTGRRDLLMNGDIDIKPSRPLQRPVSPFAPDDVTQRVRQQNLITRFNDMFASDRLDAMDTLRRYSDDHENNQRICFTAIQEAFTAAKLAFSSYKLKVRSTLAGTHIGPETLEEAVQDYINRNVDLYDLPGLVSDVVRALNRKVDLFLPPDVSFTVIQPFIRECCKMAWNMAALAHPMDISLATNAELYDDHKYRRSYDSEYTAPLVNHHIWPCLVQGIRVVMKGEACSRRGASLTPRRSRSPTRSLSPSRATSRSPSPRAMSRARSRSPSPSLRVSSRMSRSTSPSRSVAASTSLSHYGVRS